MVKYETEVERVSPDGCIDILRETDDLTGQRSRDLSLTGALFIA